MTKQVKTRQITSGELTLNYYERPDGDNDFELFYGNHSISFFQEPDDLVYELKRLVDKLEEMADDIKDGK